MKYSWNRKIDLAKIAAGVLCIIGIVNGEISGTLAWVLALSFINVELTF